MAHARRALANHENWCLADTKHGHVIFYIIELFQAGRFPFDRLIRFYDFSDINRAIADARGGDTIKPVLRIGQA